MGIKQLLRFMKPHTEKVHVKKYAGKRVGIDAYSWLYKGAYSCSMGNCLVSSNGRSSCRLSYLKYCMKLVDMLRDLNVIPVVVFDGARLPSKAATENERKRIRDANLEQARTKLSNGDVNGAIAFFKRAVHITPFMAYEFIQILKEEGVEYVVAPYEADAQLAYLSMLDPEKGGLAAVISEDSDLLAYGCSVVIYKMDHVGVGEQIDLAKAFNYTNEYSGRHSLRCFTQYLFTGMCVLAGCDYLSSIFGIGIIRAHSLVSKYQNLDQVLNVLQLEGKYQIPEDYVNSFREANALFHHARVYDANMRCLSFLRPLQEGFFKMFEGNHDFLGPEMTTSTVIAIAEGQIDPISMKSFDNFPQVFSQENSRESSNLMVVSQKQSSTLMSKNDSIPFVLFSHRAKDKFSIASRYWSSQKVKNAAYMKKGKWPICYGRSKLLPTISHSFLHQSSCRKVIAILCNGTLPRMGMPMGLGFW